MKDLLKTLGRGYAACGSAGGLADCTRAAAAAESGFAVLLQQAKGKAQG